MTDAGQPKDGRETDTADGTWLLQADAAAAAGCSLSAIRKWRRLGVVADRTRGPEGLKRVEVRLEDVLARMQDTMGLPASPPNSRPSPAEPSSKVVSVSDLDVFVRHIGEAERRAAQMEAQLQAHETMLQFLRDRVAQLQAQLEAEQARASAAFAHAAAIPDPSRLTAALRQLRQRLQRDERTDPVQRAADLAAYDAALLTACAAYGVPAARRLGERLTATERRRLTQALGEVGVDLQT